MTTLAKTELKNIGSGLIASHADPIHRSPKRLTKEQLEETKKIIIEETQDI